MKSWILDITIGLFELPWAARFLSGVHIGLTVTLTALLVWNPGTNTVINLLGVCASWAALGLMAGDLARRGAYSGFKHTYMESAKEAGLDAAEAILKKMVNAESLKSGVAQRMYDHMSEGLTKIDATDTSPPRFVQDMSPIIAAIISLIYSKYIRSDPNEDAVKAIRVESGFANGVPILTFQLPENLTDEDVCLVKDRGMMN